MNLKALRNLLRWGGIAIVLIGFYVARTAQDPSTASTGRVMTWVGFGMIVTGIVVRMFIREA